MAGFYSARVSTKPTLRWPGLSPPCTQLNALMAAVRNQEIDCVLVWKFDRFARSIRHLLMALEEFDHLGVRFVSVQDQIDTNSPMGRASRSIVDEITKCARTANA